MSCLNMNKATGMNQVPAKFTKEAFGVFAYLLSRIINVLIKPSIFTEDCKNVKRAKTTL